MENYIKLSSDFGSNSYLQHFKVAQFNLRMVIKEEPKYARRFKPRYQLTRDYNYRFRLFR